MRRERSGLRLIGSTPHAIAIIPRQLRQQARQALHDLPDSW